VTALRSSPASGISGKVVVPGDKSISHRALMIGAVAVGETTIRGLLEGDDVRRTAAALNRMGVETDRDDNGDWRVRGRGVGGLSQPDDILDLGNSGTGARLLMGLVATHPMTAHFSGDASLRQRPMARIAEPVERMGAEVLARDGGRMPLAVIGASSPVPIEYRLPVPSAQVKSAVLLAGLNTPGETRVIETKRSRDHTELMLQHFGADIRTEIGPEGEHVIVLRGEPELTARDVTVPGDPSSAAFLAVAALITPDSEITISNVGLNPLRAGVFETLTEMGAQISIDNRREQAGEPTADLTIRTSALKGVVVPAARAPSMIDEYPILAIAAAAATGTTRMEGLAELRVKESDRLAAIAEGLNSCGIETEIDGDSLIVAGTGGSIPGGGRVEAKMDHRIAMSFLIMGLAAQAPVTIDDATHIGTSFPGFVELMTNLGASIGVAGRD
jgi:3-phosphoshikimate 1-carboxyvinyltransferase